MLLLNLKKIRTAHERFEQVYQPDEFAADSTYRIVEPVALAFDIFKDKDQFHLVGTVKTMLELLCSRCLDQLPWPVDAAFDLRYHPHTANTGEGEREIEEDDLTTAFYQHDTIDLGQLIHEQLVLAVPMKPLCSEACHGLCPMCGTNLNRESCDCKRDFEDPRLAALRNLKLKTDH
ncbi:MAG: DUF177 domain-containing protein [Acidobacteria bacterium]|nr:DUF177 domain-containing protein [Acidobacteriota bacterium]